MTHKDKELGRIPIANITGWTPDELREFIAKGLSQWNLVIERQGNKVILFHQYGEVTK